MIAYLRLFSTSFIIALIIWPFLSGLLTLPILAGMFHRYHRLRTSAVFSAYISVLYLVGLVAFTLYPMPDEPVAFCAAHHIVPQLNPIRFIFDLQTGGLNAFLQLAFNIVFFMPLGFLLTRWVRWKFWIVVPVGFLVSVGIEFSQLTGFWGLYPCAYRQFDVDDMLTNTLGAILGVGVANLFSHWVPVQKIGGTEVNARPGFLHRLVTLAIDLICITIAYFPLSLGFIVLFHRFATPLPNGQYVFLGLTVNVEVTNAVAWVLSGIAYLVFEFLIPLRHNGQTLGGRFTHMTVETKERSNRQRILFFVLRFVTLYAVLQLGNTPLGFVVPWLVIALIIFWLFAKQMPYDLIPGVPKSSGIPDNRKRLDGVQSAIRDVSASSSRS